MLQVLSIVYVSYEDGKFYFVYEKDDTLEVYDNLDGIDICWKLVCVVSFSYTLGMLRLKGADIKHYIDLKKYYQKILKKDNTPFTRFDMAKRFDIVCSLHTSVLYKHIYRNLRKIEQSQLEEKKKREQEEIEQQIRKAKEGLVDE